MDIDIEICSLNPNARDRISWALKRENRKVPRSTRKKLTPQRNRWTFWRLEESLVSGKLACRERKKKKKKKKKKKTGGGHHQQNSYVNQNLPKNTMRQAKSPDKNWRSKGTSKSSQRVNKLDKKCVGGERMRIEASPQTRCPREMSFRSKSKLLNTANRTQENASNRFTEINNCFYSPWANKLKPPKSNDLRGLELITQNNLNCQTPTNEQGKG